MTLSITRRHRRPSWMTPFGHEGFGDVFFDRLGPEYKRDMGEEWHPTVDFFERDGKYYLAAEVPGMKKEDISVSFNNGCLTISGKKESNHEDEGVDYYMKEARTGSFCRSFNLPKEVDEEKFDASYNDGVLTLVMPFREESDAKKIEIH